MQCFTQKYMQITHQRQITDDLVNQNVSSPLWNTYIFKQFPLQIQEFSRTHIKLLMHTKSFSSELFINVIISGPNI
jgi:hypothetical protein